MVLERVCTMCGAVVPCFTEQAFDQFDVDHRHVEEWHLSSQGDVH